MKTFKFTIVPNIIKKTLFGKDGVTIEAENLSDAVEKFNTEHSGYKKEQLESVIECIDTCKCNGNCRCTESYRNPIGRAY